MMDKLILFVADNIEVNGEPTISIKCEITDDELEVLNSAFSFCGIYNSITQIKDIVIENGESFKRYMSSKNLKRVQSEKTSPKRAIMLANKAVLNYATSIKTYIDMETRLIKENLTEKIFKQFSESCHKLYDTRMEYRFWVNFRNYIIHCEFPYSVCEESVEDGLHIICTKERLLRFKNWKHAEADIQTMEEQIDLPKLVDNMSAMIYGLYIEFFRFFADQIISGIKIYGEFCRKHEVNQPIIVKTADRNALVGANMQPLPIKELKASFDILKSNPNIQINIV